MYNDKLHRWLNNLLNDDLDEGIGLLVISLLNLVVHLPELIHWVDRDSLGKLLAVFVAPVAEELDDAAHPTLVATVVGNGECEAPELIVVLDTNDRLRALPLDGAGDAA